VRTTWHFAGDAARPARSNDVQTNAPYDQRPNSDLARPAAPVATPTRRAGTP
jgi:hypothetical protein